MTENEYILCTDLKSLDAAMWAVRQVVPANNPHVPHEERADVLRTIQRWIDAIRKDITVR